MCLFVETIKVCDGKALHLDYHNCRMNATIRRFSKDEQCPVFRLEDWVRPAPDMGLYKARVVYTPEKVVESTLSPYAVRRIESLRLVYDNGICYEYKSADRSCLTRLTERKDGCDDIIIVRCGLLTDTSFTNIALFDGRRWITPARPLLRGTKRQWLLDRGEIVEGDIRTEALSRYKSVRLFNAMIEFGEIEIPVQAVVL